MNEVLVTSVEHRRVRGEDRLTENVTLNFAKFKFEYTPQKETGGADATVNFAFDIAANKAEK